MKYTISKSASMQSNHHGVEVKKLYDAKNAQVVLIRLAPGESLKPHTTPVDVFFWIVSGSPAILVGEETMVFEPGTLVESPANIIHCISNLSDIYTEVLVVKTPNPAMQTQQH